MSILGKIYGCQVPVPVLHSSQLQWYLRIFSQTPHKQATVSSWQVKWGGYLRGEPAPEAAQALVKKLLLA